MYDMSGYDDIIHIHSILAACVGCGEAQVLMEEALEQQGNV